MAFILPLVAMLTKEPEMLQQDAFCEHTMQQNVTATTASPAGDLTTLPQTPLARFKGGGALWRAEGEKGTRTREKGSYNCKRMSHLFTPL